VEVLIELEREREREREKDNSFIERETEREKNRAKSQNGSASHKFHIPLRSEGQQNSNDKKDPPQRFVDNVAMNKSKNNTNFN